MSFAENLKKLRKEKGWTQDDLAKKVRMHTKHISKYEMGLVKPTSDAIVRIANALETSSDYLLFDTIKDKSDLISKKLTERYTELQKLNDEDKEIIISIIDAFIKKNKYDKTTK